MRFRLLSYCTLLFGPVCVVVVVWVCGGKVVGAWIGWKVFVGRLGLKAFGGGVGMLLLIGGRLALVIWNVVAWCRIEVGVGEAHGVAGSNRIWGGGMDGGTGDLERFDVVSNFSLVGVVKFWF